MSKEKAKQLVESLLSKADIKINGNRPWDLQVHKPEFYKRVLTEGRLGLGESYMDGWWDSQSLDQFFYKVISAGLDGKAHTISILWTGLKSKLINLQSKLRAKTVGRKHYDKGNELFRNMLDRRMVYSCGYWKSADTLDKAQEAKLDLVCRKINLQPGMKVLDIGCGWGSYEKFAAENYNAKVVGVTISKEQVKLAEKLCKTLPVEIRFQDYRDVNEKFDRIISIGMFEHVGEKNYRTFMKTVNRCLKDDGLFLLHTIAGNVPVKPQNSPWLVKYIFPNSMIPSAKQIISAAEGLFTIQDWHNIGPHYDPTLMAWYNNFKEHWDRIKSNYDERFYRMWTYYLLSCAGGFRARDLQVWQVVFSKNELNEAYQAER